MATDPPAPAPAVPAPPVQHKAPRPPGVLPPHAQTWVIGGIAGVMLVIIAISGRPTGDPTPTSLPKLSVTDPDPQRIKAYAARVDEQMRQLAEEKARLALTTRQLGLSSSADGSWAQSSPADRRQSRDSEDAASTREPARRDGPEIGPTNLAHERTQREYDSLFASNIALSYRETPSPPRPERLNPPLAPAVPRISPSVDMTRGDTRDAASIPPPVPAPVPPDGAPRPGRPSDHAPAIPAGVARSVSVAPSDEPRYPLLEGTVIETVLTNRLIGSLAGPVNCLVTTPVYAHDRQHLLIPQGSRVLGEVRRVDRVGQERLAVVFHRLIFPNGATVSLDQVQGLSQIGETGLADQTDRHYAQTFGMSIALGGLAGLAQAQTSYGAFGMSAADAYRQGVAANLSQSSVRMLDRYLNVLPTFTIREGHRVKVYLSADLQLPAYRD